MKKILQLSFLTIFFTTSMFAEKQGSLQGITINCEEIDIGCLILGRETTGEHIVKNNTEYQELIQFRSPHSNCDNYQLPVVDFNKYTLIGYISSIAGCDSPQISHEIRKQNNQYMINITIIQQGVCKRNNPVKVWCLIPKVDESSAIKFNVEITTNSN